MSAFAHVDDFCKLVKYEQISSFFQICHKYSKVMYVLYTDVPKIMESVLSIMEIAL